MLCGLDRRLLLLTLLLLLWVSTHEDRASEDRVKALVDSIVVLVRMIRLVSGACLWEEEQEEDPLGSLVENTGYRRRWSPLRRDFRDSTVVFFVVMIVEAERTRYAAREQRGVVVGAEGEEIVGMYAIHGVIVASRKLKSCWRELKAMGRRSTFQYRKESKVRKLLQWG